MPTYEYKCENCGHTFEKFQSITAAPIKKCPQCGKLKVRRLIGMGAGMIFKGSGFYITDYRDSSYKDSAKADSKEAAPAAASSDGKTGSATEGKDKSSGATTETKPAAPTPAAPAPSEKKTKSEGKARAKKSD